MLSTHHRERSVCQRWMRGRAINVSPERGLRFEDDDDVTDGNVADMTKSTTCAVFDMMSSSPLSTRDGQWRLMRERKRICSIWTMTMRPILSLSSTLRQTRVTMPACLPATKSKEGRRKGGKGNVVRKERHTAKDDTKNNSLEPKTFLCFRTADGRQAFCQPRVAWMEGTNERVRMVGGVGGDIRPQPNGDRQGHNDDGRRDGGPRTEYRWSINTSSHTHTHTHTHQTQTNSKLIVIEATGESF